MMQALVCWFGSEVWLENLTVSFPLTRFCTRAGMMAQRAFNRPPH